jgi:hypothetical protein
VTSADPGVAADVGARGTTGVDGDRCRLAARERRSGHGDEYVCTGREAQAVGASLVGVGGGDGAARSVLCVDLSGDRAGRTWMVGALHRAGRPRRDVAVSPGSGWRRDRRGRG